MCFQEHNVTKLTVYVVLSDKYSTIEQNLSILEQYDNACLLLKQQDACSKGNHKLDLFNIQNVYPRLK